MLCLKTAANRGSEAGRAPARILRATSAPTARAASGVDSVAKVRSLAAAASPAVAATAAPASRSGAQRSGVRFLTVTSKPAFSRFFAWPGHRQRVSVC